jgi:hypothetical protein
MDIIQMVWGEDDLVSFHDDIFRECPERRSLSTA